MLFCFISIKSLSNPRSQDFLVCFNLEVVGSCILYLPMIHFVVNFCKRCMVSGVILLCTHVKLLQSCSALCDSMDHNLPGASVHGILQARILNWVAISSSQGIPGILTQGSNMHLLCLLYWLVGSLPLVSPGNSIWTSNCSSILIVKFNIRRINGFCRLYVFIDELVNKTNMTIKMLLSL